jgi:hypothetical protein
MAAWLDDPVLGLRLESPGASEPVPVRWIFKDSLIIFEIIEY